MPAAPSSFIHSPIPSGPFSLVHLGFTPQLHPSPTSYLNRCDHSDIVTPPSSDTGPQSADRTLELFCWVQGDDPRHVFPLEIAETKTVGALKEAIKEKKKPAFDHVVADTLNLWRVSASYQDEPMPLLTARRLAGFHRHDQEFRRFS